jgi:hypothetical protein
LPERDWAKQGLLQAACWPPGRRIVAVIDSGYAVLDLPGKWKPSRMSVARDGQVGPLPPRFDFDAAGFSERDPNRPATHEPDQNVAGRCPPEPRPRAGSEVSGVGSSLANRIQCAIVHVDASSLGR